MEIKECCGQIRFVPMAGNLFSHRLPGTGGKEILRPLHDSFRAY
ncbi:hypothetical protein B4098_0788 [Heyndrickxia coagulans]|uniref:Uncharacterized protein n=1 Tax=Heyndrickxia coagulans TaxID=1398 RepID=A0A150K051_HEYCO|nr:hypothetical protein B4100_0873 [Heyndrickxia coagulans]KYC66757.1 hypothetical protein B4098_0788 [Heyndrickxia coagulans]